MAVFQMCNKIHNTVEKSGLHYSINQTPFSSYITIRKKLINPEVELLSDSVETGVEDQKCKCEMLQIQNSEFARQIKALENKFSEVNDYIGDLEKAKADVEEQLADDKKKNKYMEECIKSKDKKLCEMESLKESVKRLKKDEDDYERASMEWNKVVRIKEKEIHNLQKRLDNSVETIKHLKENSKEILEDKNAANKQVKNLEKKFKKEKQKLVIKVANLEEELLKKSETKSVQVQTMVSELDFKTSSTFDENSNVFNLPGPISDTFKTSGKKTGEKKDFKLKKQKNTFKRKSSVFVPSSSLLIKTKLLISYSSPLRIPVVASEFQCPFCDKIFESKLMLGFHVICECQKVKCAICDKSFLSKAEFADHIKQHNSETECGTQLSDKDKEYLKGLRKTIKTCFGYIVENQ